MHSAQSERLCNGRHPLGHATGAQAGARSQFPWQLPKLLHGGVTGGARLARADGPDRLIRDDDVLPVGDAVRHALQLPLQDGIHLCAWAGPCQALPGGPLANPPCPLRPPAGLQGAGQPGPERLVRCTLADCAQRRAAVKRRRNTDVHCFSAAQRWSPVSSVSSSPGQCRMRG